ncbi:MAG: F0F1 ATP synthase subunit A [Deltaproteobacteria bacterium]|nr:F0F1 ATP synthase subunit A [Deltaproteobacteria bacterium]
MPHGESWLSFLSFYSDLHEQASAYGPSWIGHNPDIGVQHVVSFTFVILILAVLSLVVSRKLVDVKAALVPEDKLTLRTFVEIFVEAVYGMMEPMMGKRATRFFLPLIGTCAFLIFFSNTLGLVPGFVPPTGNFNTTLACASVIFFATHVFGVKEHGLEYFKHFLGPIWWMSPLILLVEMVSHLVRPASLSIRLMANMVADHLVLGIFLGLFAGMFGGFGLLIPVPVAMYGLGCIVVIVQTLVFCLLSTVYISMAIAHEGH